LAMTRYHTAVALDGCGERARALAEAAAALSLYREARDIAAEDVEEWIAERDAIDEITGEATSGDDRSKCTEPRP
ncbi:MAG TPA: hypothetical protein VD866_22290, partial [Urbifossiella sp.]|nr:hypothetical protein [Urbifossiella sp.]